MKKSNLIIALIGATILYACQNKDKAIIQGTTTETQQTATQDTTPLPTADNSQTSLDWEGTYEGTLPCADCEGILTTLTLTGDHTYELSEKYMGGKSDGKPTITKGKFEWNAHGSNITITDGTRKQHYKVGENQLFHLDSEGKIITGNLAENYILKKQP